MAEIIKIQLNKIFDGKGTIMNSSSIGKRIIKFEFDHIWEDDIIDYFFNKGIDLRVLRYGA